MKSLSRVWLFVTLWTVAYQVPPSMRFSRQGYWSGLPFPFPGDLPDSGIELLHCRLTLYCLSHQGSQKMPGKSSVYILRSISIGNITPYELFVMPTSTHLIPPTSQKQFPNRFTFTLSFSSPLHLQDLTRHEAFSKYFLNEKSRVSQGHTLTA